MNASKFRLSSLVAKLEDAVVKGGAAAKTFANNIKVEIAASALADAAAKEAEITAALVAASENTDNLAAQRAGVEAAAIYARTEELLASRERKEALKAAVRKLRSGEVAPEVVLGAAKTEGTKQ